MTTDTVLSPGRELTISRLVNAPRDLVWKIWTEPEHIKHWWGPNGFTNTIFKMDVEPGGVWDFIMHGPDGTDYKNKHIYKEVIKPSKLVLEHVTAPKFKMTVTFKEQGNKTLIAIHSVFESEEQLKEVIRVFKADEGMKQNMNKLENYLNQIQYDHLNKMSLGEITNQPDGFKVRFERILSHPIEQIWDALTNTEILKIWFTDIEMDFKVGGKITIWFRDESRTVSFGKIVRIEPPNIFEYTWEDELATWELFTEETSKCKLVLTYSKLPDEYVISVPAGWHILLDQLETVLNGRTEPYPFGGGETETTRKLKAIYADITNKIFPQLNF